MILAALAAGKHVFCEKPVGMNSSELVDITRAAEQAPGLLGVCYQNRLNPTSLRIRQALEDGELGKMLSIKAVLTWSRSGAYYTESPWRGRLATEGGSLLINQAIHTLDLMQWFAGGVTRVKGVAIRRFYHAISHPGNANYTDIREAGKSLTLVEAIYRSSQLRQWIELNK
ncbi:hypothetical protein L1887_42866 [Cichorium endivia]|nr:hypothetical protein L1887_42866 [Cichorium endivia]